MELLINILFIYRIWMKSVKQINKRAFSPNAPKVTPYIRRTNHQSARKNLTLITPTTPTSPIRNSTHPPTATRNGLQTTSKKYWSSKVMQWASTASWLSQLTIVSWLSSHPLSCPPAARANWTTSSTPNQDNSPIKNATTHIPSVPTAASTLQHIKLYRWDQCLQVWTRTYYDL